MPDDNAPLTGAELRVYLDSQDDFAFEREVFTHAKGFGLQVQHAGLYEDPLSEKSRQFDLRASMVNGDLRIRLALECKVFRPANPLLVSCVPRPRDEAFHEVMSSPSAHFHRVVSALYPPDEPVGKQMRQVARAKGGFTATNERDLFDKYQQALASSADLVNELAVELWPTRSPEQFGAVLPILVVPEGTLWIARYSSRGGLERDPESVPEVTFYLGRKYSIQANANRFFTISHLHIMTKTAVANFLRQVGKLGPGGIWQLLFEAR